MNSIEELSIETETPQRSGLATAALISSLIVCCPITTIVGPILGIISLATLKGRSGKGFAWTAIVVGLISTVLWIGAAVFFGGLAKKFIEQVGEVTTKTIEAGYDGDYDAFRTGLSRSSMNVTDEEIESFISELTLRYGKFDYATMNLEEQTQTLKPAADEAPISVRLIFETTDVNAEVLMHIIKGTGIEFESKIGCFRINDAENGDLIFPKDSYCAPEVQKSIELPAEPTGS